MSDGKFVYTRVLTKDEDVSRHSQEQFDGVLTIDRVPAVSLCRLLEGTSSVRSISSGLEDMVRSVWTAVATRVSTRDCAVLRSNRSNNQVLRVSSRLVASRRVS